jgi:flagellar basal-body rod protein FlgG
MLRAFSSSATGMAAQQLLLDNTANNLANLHTTGFKKSTAEFQDLLYSTLKQPGATSVQGQQVPTGIQLGNGVKVSGTTRLFTNGTLQNTGNNLDMAIQGDGFFQIVNPAGGYLYTRDGTFRLNSNYQLVTSDGYFVNPQMTFPADTISVSVGVDGTVTATTAGSPTTATTVGKLTLTRFPNPPGLSAQGQNLFAETPASGTAQSVTPGQNGSGTIQGGFLEQSNVDVVAEMVNLIQAQRSYEFNTKAVQTADQMLSDSTNLIR